MLDVLVRAGEDGREGAAESLDGIAPGFASRCQSPLSDQDIAAADQSKREWLRARQREGKTVCSIITEAQLAARLGVASNDGFRSSVPFVATASASLVLAAAVKTHAFPKAPAPSMFQISSMFLGPDHSAPIERVGGSPEALHGAPAPLVALRPAVPAHPPPPRDTVPAYQSPCLAWER